MLQLGTESHVELAASLARLRELHERYQRFAEHAQDMLYVMSLPERSYSYVNPVCYRICGFSPEEFYARPGLEEELLHPDWKHHYRNSLKSLIAGNTPASFEYWIVHKSGETRWLFQRSVLARDPDGAPAAIEGIVTDITHRNAVEEAQKLERNRAQQYLDIAGVALIGLNVNGNISLINRKGCEILEYESDADLLGKNWFECCLPPEVAEESRTVFQRSLAGLIEPARAYETPVLTSKGERRIIAWQSKPLHDEQGKCLGTLSSGEDVTDRWRSERALRESEQRLRLLSDAAFEGLVVSEEGRFIDANRALLEMLGYTRDDLLGRATLSLVHPEDRELVTEKMQSGYDGVYEHRVIRKDGSVLFLEVRGKWTTLEGRPIRVTAVRDVTQRKQSEETSRLLQTAIDQAAESVLVTNADAKIEYANPALERFTGYRLDELVGKSPAIFASGEQSRESLQQMWATLQRGEVWNGRLVSKRKDETLFNQETTMSPVRDANGRITHYVSVGRDVTHEAELETRLRQAQKMEAMGTLAGGIAHDFNNLLQAMLGYADLVKSDLPADSPTRDFIDQVISAGDRAVELVGQILAFSRQTDREQRPLRLQSIVKETLKLLRPTIPTTIDITQHIDADCLPILADATEVHQTIMNLCTNAFHAMRENGGLLDVRVEQTTVGSDGQSDLFDVEPGEYARLTVSDTGTGMDETVLARAFDPYFTTKPVGEGTGMGLATVLGIAEKNGGTVTVDSELGQGSVFRMYWPVITRESSAENTESMTNAEHTGTECILLVDDEELVLGQVKAGLERLGYSVEARTSSVEALKAFEADPARYDAVITDQTMPNMTGLDLARHILATYPNTPVILCSGFSELVDDARAKSVGICGFVRKPMLTSDLAGELRRAFERSDKE